MDLGSDVVRGGIERFLPFSFDLVNKAAKTYFKNDRRYVYTTPKSYLELLKLYKDLLQRKRDQVCVNCVCMWGGGCVRVCVCVTFYGCTPLPATSYLVLPVPSFPYSCRWAKPSTV